MGYNEHKQYLYNISHLGQLTSEPYNAENEEGNYKTRDPDDDVDPKVTALYCDICRYLRADIQKHDGEIALLGMMYMGISEYVHLWCDYYRLKDEIEAEDGKFHDDEYDDVVTIVRERNESRGYAMAAWEAYKKLYPNMVHDKAFATKEDALADGNEHPFHIRCGQCGADFWAGGHTRYTRHHQASCPRCGQSYEQIESGDGFGFTYISDKGE